MFPMHIGTAVFKTKYAIKRLSSNNRGIKCERKKEIIIKKETKNQIAGKKKQYNKKKKDILTG